jgi:poly(A) polymerase
VIDYVGGLDDLRAGLVRAIGDPEVRFREDPVRMMRAVALAARLDFKIDEASLGAIRAHRHEIARSSPPRLLEEYYKILRAGSSERAFRELASLGLLEPISKELHQGAESVMASLAELDAFRRRFESTPDTLTNAILLGSLIAPLGLLRDRPRYEDPSRNRHRPAADSESTAVDAQPIEAAPENDNRRPQGPRLGELPLARRDVENLRHILGLQRRLRDLGANPRAKRALTHRHIFRDALTWMEIHGGAPEIVEHWKALAADTPPLTEGAAEGVPPEPRPGRQRRRRRRRRFHSTTGH